MGWDPSRPLRRRPFEDHQLKLFLFLFCGGGGGGGVGRPLVSFVRVLRSVLSSFFFFFFCGRGGHVEQGVQIYFRQKDVPLARAVLLPTEFSRDS